MGGGGGGSKPPYTCLTIGAVDMFTDILHLKFYMYMIITLFTVAVDEMIVMGDISSELISVVVKPEHQGIYNIQIVYERAMKLKFCVKYSG